MAASAPPDQAPRPAPRGGIRSGRRLVLVVLVVVAVVLPAAAVLLGRVQPATRLAPLPPPSSVPTAARAYPHGTPAPTLRLPGLDSHPVHPAPLHCHPVVVNLLAP